MTVRPAFLVCLVLVGNMRAAEPADFLACDDACLSVDQNLTAIPNAELLGCDACDSCGGCVDKAWWEGLLDAEKSLLSDINSGLKPTGFSLSGYLLHGVTSTSDDPRNPPSGLGNLPAGGPIYRSDDYQLNRFLLTLARKPAPLVGDWSMGGVATAVYGSDYFFLQSRGLETHRNFSNKWNDGGSGIGGTALTGVALPNLYATLVNPSIDTSVKVGHFYHPGGFEQFESLGGSLAYSSTYSLSFVSFRFVTGMETSWKMNDQTTVLGGVHRGRRNWEDNNNHVNGYGGFQWKSDDGDTSLNVIMDVGAEDNAGNNQQYVQSIVASQKLTDDLTYFMHSDYGYVENAGAAGKSAQFYGFSNYIFYDLTPKWVVGCRYEIFNDIDGTRVLPQLGVPGLSPGVFQQFALGAVYKMTPDLWFRWGLRWDWYNPDGPAPSGPFNEFKKRDQTMLFMAMQLKL